MGFKALSCEDGSIDRKELSKLVVGEDMQKKKVWLALVEKVLFLLLPGCQCWSLHTERHAGGEQGEATEVGGGSILIQGPRNSCFGFQGSPIGPAWMNSWSWSRRLEINYEKAVATIDAAAERKDGQEVGTGFNWAEGCHGSRPS